MTKYVNVTVSDRNISMVLAVGQFMTECFINHELYASRIHIGPSLGNNAREVDFDVVLIITTDMIIF